MFEEAGWSVCGEASNGQEAIVKAQELRPKVIVLDLSMPQINGVTAGRILKETLPGTPLILFTAFGALLRRTPSNLQDFRRQFPRVLPEAIVQLARNVPALFILQHGYLGIERFQLLGFAMQLRKRLHFCPKQLWNNGNGNIVYGSVLISL
jgi:CheY-like chemotaxis protein